MYIYIYICINVFILHNHSFDNQGSDINKNDIFLRFDKLSFAKTLYIYYTRANKTNKQFYAK